MAAGAQAMRDMLDVSGEAKRRMVELLFDLGLWDRDRLTPQAAYQRFNDSLNPEKPAFFKTAELWAIMRHTGRHQLFLAMAHDLGYAVRRVDQADGDFSPAERAAELLAELQALLPTIAVTDSPAQSGGPRPNAARSPMRFSADQHAPGGF